jgi:acetylglutamate kinase
MVLSGEINSEIVSLLNHFGAKAIGVSGKDSHFIKAEPKDREKFGRTGKITDVDASVIHKLIDEKFIPVIAPIATGSELGDIGYNINADFAASAVAKAVGASKVLFLTDTQGILDKENSLIHSLNMEDVENLKKDGTIYGGMIPKIDACIEAIKGGVNKAHIIDGRVEHSILLEILTSEGVGTEFIQ